MSHKTAGMLQPAREGAEVTIGEASPKPEPHEPPEHALPAACPPPLPIETQITSRTCCHPCP